MVGASVHSIGAVRRRLPPLRQRWRRLTLASLSRYARGDINRSRKARRLASRVGGHDAGMQWSGSMRSWASARALGDMQLCTAPDVSTEQSSRGEECQTSTRDQGEQPDGRVHRRTRCRKRQRAADAPRFNGSVLPAYVERSRYVCPAEPYRPSRLLMRHSGGLLYVPKDL